ncbi:hypothetical protein IHQ76_05590 [Bifidobacterium dentium]|uniref:hypothetical protein n=1 Tax=Bifidobacterium dentium TaxID=1689 RepID=UPI0018C21FF9|nr:hypothetical protein [Bifidobacterium dentium]MBF9696267.1 hypothetical protein [Bifidobacterium dentium]MBF9712426.1 hypothetical protein [Bifidobacterium dentium]MBF9714388.1 hypothetical protein [Bifidobacterium dentium]MBF9718360.1 hypothetical protein [Bifidobacterium dentium]
MARPNGGYTAFSPIPTNQNVIASQMMAEDVTLVESFDKETKTYSPRVNADGLNQYEVQTLFIPLAGDERHTVAIVPVKIWAKSKPTIKANAPVTFINFKVNPYRLEDGKTGMSYQADGFKQD